MRRKATLLGLTALTLFSFAAFAASSAYAAEAEEPNNPRVLVLAEEASGLKFALTGTNVAVVGLKGEQVNTAKVAALLEGCKNITGNTKDTNLCTDVPIHFEGVKKEEVTCRSENNKGEKDPAGTVLALLDLHMGAELHLNAGGTATVLLSVIVASILGTALETGVIFNCALVKVKLEGNIACLVEPGLTNIPITAEVELKCRVNEKTHDPETGECNVLCTVFGPIGVFETIGATKEDVWDSLTLKGKPNKDIFIDD